MLFVDRGEFSGTIYNLEFVSRCPFNKMCLDESRTLTEDELQLTVYPTSVNIPMPMRDDRREESGNKWTRRDRLVENLIEDSLYELKTTLCHWKDN